MLDKIGTLLLTFVKILFFKIVICLLKTKLTFEFLINKLIKMHTILGKVIN